MQSNAQLALRDTSGGDLQLVSAAMKDYIQNESEQALETINANAAKNPGLWRRIFPNAFEKENTRIKLDQIRTIYEAKKVFFKLYTDIQLEMARRQGDALLISLGTVLTAQVSAIATKQLEELAKTLGESRERYLARIAPQIDNLEKYQNYPDLQLRARQSIENEWITVFDAMDTLLDTFKRAMNSRIEPMRDSH
jgi:hypothetical protein